MTLALVGAAAMLVTAAPAPSQDREPNSRAGDGAAADGPGLPTDTLLDRPAIPITLPKGLPEQVRPSDLPEGGAVVVDRVCRLIREERTGWWLLAFDAEAGRPPEPPRRVLPCRFLEQMEAVAAAGAAAAPAAAPACHFRTSGETTVYKNAPYILPRKVTVQGSQAAKAPAAAPAAAPVAPGPVEHATRPAAASSAPSSPAATEPTADEVLNALLKGKTGRPIPLLPLGERPIAVPSVAPAPAATELPPDRGAMVVDRLVRVLPDEESAWWVVRFESDNTLQEPPLKLLPCALLEKAQELHGKLRLHEPLVLRVTGEVTEYRDDRFLLLRKLLVERQLGRF